MFNRNINPRQFSLDDEPAAPLGSGSAAPSFRNRKGTPIPLAGGTFTPDEDPPMERNETHKVTHTEHLAGPGHPGTFITQSAQTVMPGRGSWGYYDDRDEPYVTFVAGGERPEHTGYREPGKGPDWYVSSGYRADTPGIADVVGRYGSDPQTGRSHTGVLLPFEQVGEHIRSKRKDLE
jgi:hypothetical protein